MFKRIVKILGFSALLATVSIEQLLIYKNHVCRKIVSAIRIPHVHNLTIFISSRRCDVCTTIMDDFFT